jgi:hypothetical protein
MKFVADDDDGQGREDATQDALFIPLCLGGECDALERKSGS